MSQEKKKFPIVKEGMQGAKKIKRCRNRCDWSRRRMAKGLRPRR